jgi:hypothetical protein
MLAGTVISTTFKIYVGVSAGTVTFNGSTNVRRWGGVLTSTLRITEVMG